MRRFVRCRGRGVAEVWAAVFLCGENGALGLRFGFWGCFRLWCFRDLAACAAGVSPSCRRREASPRGKAESLFSCWPKRKVTQREWPSEPELIALRWDKPERLRMVVAWQPPPPQSEYFGALRNAPKRRGLKAQGAAALCVAFLWERTLCATNLRSDTDEAPVAHRVRSHKGFASSEDRIFSIFAFAFAFAFASALALALALRSWLSGTPYDSGGRVEE